MKWVILFIIIVIAIVCVCLVLGNRRNRDFDREDKEQMDAISEMNHQKKKR